jgi:serine protease Do
MQSVRKDAGRSITEAPPGLPLWVCAVLVFLALATLTPLRATGGNEPRAGVAAPDLEQIEKAFEQVVAQVSPSVVGIRVQRRYVTTLPSTRDSATDSVFEQLVTVNGGGTIIDRNGLILTNEHVVQAADEIEVLFHDGQLQPATVIGADTRSDLAVLKVNRDDLPPAPIADWSSVTRCQWTIAFGNPYGLGGDGSLSVSVGVVSNLGRRLPGLGEVDDRFYSDMIQTTAAIHPGSSGGPLFNIRGELIGVVTAMHTRAPADEGVGFAIPMTPAKHRLVRRLSQGKSVDYGYLGLVVRDARPQERQAADVGPQIGVVVQEVDPEGPAAKVGVREGDLVVRFQQKDVQSPAMLAELVGQSLPGAKATLELWRHSQRLILHPVLQRREVSHISWMRGGAILWRGIRLANLTPHSRTRMGVDAAARGVVVIDVARNSPAQRAAVRIGDVIDCVVDTPVSDVTAFRASVRDQKGSVKIHVRGRGELIIQP